MRSSARRMKRPVSDERAFAAGSCPSPLKCHCLVLCVSFLFFFHSWLLLLLSSSLLRGRVGFRCDSRRQVRLPFFFRASRIPPRRSLTSQCSAIIAFCALFSPVPPLPLHLSSSLSLIPKPSSSSRRPWKRATWRARKYTLRTPYERRTRL